MSNPNRPIGHNKLAEMAPNFALKCGFDNATQHKAHGKRALGITMLSNSSVSEQMKLKASRHSNLKTHARYQRINDENIKKKYEAMNPSLLNASSKDAKSTNLASLPDKNLYNDPETKNQSASHPQNQSHHTNVLNNSFDNNSSYAPPNQVVINIGNSNLQQSSPYFSRAGSNFIPSSTMNSSTFASSTNNNQINESDIINKIMEKIS